MDSEKTQEVTLFVSRNSLFEYKFRRVNFPFGQLREQSYTILDASEEQTFIHVTHFSEIVQQGHIYISDSSGSQFSLSQKHNIRDEKGFCDFEKIRSLPGLFLSNVYSKDSLEMAQYEVNSLNEAERDNKDGRVSYAQRKQDVLSKVLQIQSQISWNRGAQWEFIRPPVSQFFFVFPPSLSTLTPPEPSE